MSTPHRLQIFALFVPLLFAISGVPAQNPSLSPATWQTFPSGPSGMGGRILVADANSDGLPDAIASDIVSNRIVCFLRTPGGGWGSPTITSVGHAFPVLLGALDLDMDGLPDLVVQTTSGVINLMGTGTGSFTPGSLQTPPLSLSLNTWGQRSPAYSQHALGDVDGDGAIELVSIRGARLPPQLVSTYELVAGSWSLTQTTVFPNMIGGWLPALGDYDGNGLPDLTVVPYRTAYIFPNSIAICLNTSGSFSVAPQSPFSMNIWYMTAGVADVSGDGLSDFVFTDSETGGNVVVKCFLGNPQSVLQMPPILTPATIKMLPEFGDFDADGIQDLAQAAPNWNAGTLNSQVHLGRSGGSLSMPIQGSYGPFTGVGWGAFGVGDLENDGDADMIFVRDGPGGGCDIGFVTSQAIYGPGAVGIGQVPGFLAGTATPGNNAFTLSLVNANPGLPAGLAVSLAPSVVTPPIWVDLLPGNLVLPQGQLGLFTTDALGRAEVTVSIPPSAALLGTTFYAQWAVSDLAGIPYGAFALALSPARQIVIW